MDLLELVNIIIKKYGIDFLSKKIEVNKGTIKRWIIDNNIPNYYKFDLYKLNNIKINYNDLSDREKDKFYTDDTTAKHCYDIFKSKLVEYGETISDFIFIEPAAGNGSFFKIIENQKIGIDIHPEFENVIENDYLEWYPTDLDKKYVLLGNPPFGLRGNLALRFINHSQYADYIGFILPKTFGSDGKGSCKKRVKGFNLIYSEEINPQFYFSNGTPVNVNVIFQIWSKYKKVEVTIKETKSFIKLYSVSNGPNPNQTRNKKMIGKCDFYLPITCFGEQNMKLYFDFEQLPKKMGIGIILKNKNDNFKKFLYTTDWSKIAFKSTNGAYNLRFDLIHTHLINNGYVDDVVGIEQFI